jgi:excinuclease UvrABC ATPase subunit
MSKISTIHYVDKSHIHYVDKSHIPCPYCGAEQHLGWTFLSVYTDHTKKYAKRNGFSVAFECGECYHMKGQPLVQIIYADFEKDQLIANNALLEIAKIIYPIQ